MADKATGADWSETQRESYPGGAGRGQESETSNLEVLLNTQPAPLPVVAMLLIVLWLWVPFIVSMVFLAVVLGIFSAAEKQHHYKIEQPLDDMNQFLSTIMQKKEHASPATGES